MKVSKTERKGIFRGFMFMIVLVLLSAPIMAEIVPENIISYYSFDDDLSDTFENINLTEGTQPYSASDGILGDGQTAQLYGNYLEGDIPAEFNFSSDSYLFSVNFWINYTTTGTWNIFSLDDNGAGDGTQYFQIKMVSEDRFYYIWRSGSTQGYIINPLPLRSSEMYMVTAVRDGAYTVKFYIDSENVLNISTGQSIVSANVILDKLNLNQYGGSGNVLDEVMIYEGVLSQSDIDALYNEGDGVSLTAVSITDIASPDIFVDVDTGTFPVYINTSQLVSTTYECSLIDDITDETYDSINLSGNNQDVVLNYTLNSSYPYHDINLSVSCDGSETGINAGVNRYSPLNSGLYNITDFNLYQFGDQGYSLVSNTTLELMNDRHFMIFGDFDIEKTSLSGQQTTYIRIDIDGVTELETDIVYLNSVGDSRSVSIPVIHVDLLSGNRSVEIYFQEMGIGGISVTDAQLNTIAVTDPDLKELQETSFSFIGNLTGTSWTNIGNVSPSHYDGYSIWADISSIFRNTGTPLNRKECYIVESVSGEYSPMLIESNSGGNIIESSGITWIYEDAPEDPLMQFFCRQSEDAVTEYDFSGYFLDMEYDNGDRLSGFTIRNGTERNFSASVNNLLASFPYTAQSSNTIGIASVGYISSMSGSQTISVWSNSSRCPVLQEHSSAFASTGQVDTIKFYYECPNMVVGEQTIFYLWANVTTGETISVYNVSLSGIEISDLNTSENPVTPIQGVVIYPPNGSNVTNNNVVINWSAWSDPNIDDVVTYDIFIDGVLEYENLTETSQLHDFGLYLDQLAIDVIVQGCDTTEMCSNATAVFGYPDPYPEVEINVSSNTITWRQDNMTISWSVTDNNFVSSLLIVESPNGTSIYNNTDMNGTIVLTPELMLEMGVYNVILYENDTLMNEFQFGKSFRSSKPMIVIDISTTSGAIILFILAFFYIGLMSIAFFFKNFAIGGLSFFIGVFIGFALIPISGLLGVGFLLIDAVIFFSIATLNK